MTRAGDSFARTAEGEGAPTPLATVVAGGKEHPVVVAAMADGHLDGTLPDYFLVVGPRATTTTVTDYFDLWNGAGSGHKIWIRTVKMIAEFTAAVAYTTNYRFDAFRTSAIGTGGTAHANNGAAAPAAGAVNIAECDSLAADLPAQITARGLPTGGATAAAYLFSAYQLVEETNPASIFNNDINWLPMASHGVPVVINEGQGFKIRQVTAVAGPPIGFVVGFSLVPA